MKHWKIIILILTHKIWNKVISKVLCNAYHEGLITSNQLHNLASRFDPTQKHEVYKNQKR